MDTVKEQYKGSLRLKPGQSLYEINLDNRTIGMPQFEESKVVENKGLKLKKFGNKRKAVESTIGTTNHKKLLIKERCVYIEAINFQNAIRKLYKRYKALAGYTFTKI